jgi:hypothetical protein
MKDFDKEDVVQFVRLLAELNAAGLTRNQHRFLKASADLDSIDVDNIMAKAEKAYEQIKDSLANKAKIYKEYKVWVEIKGINKKRSFKTLDEADDYIKELTGQSSME